MPELPDITIYIDALQKRILGQPLEQIRITNPFLLRTVLPPIQTAHGKTVRSLRRLGKRIVIGLDDDYWLVLHLMIAGRLHWAERNDSSAATRSQSSGKYALASFDFPNGSLLLTEAGTKKRASLHFLQGEEALRSHNPGGLRSSTPLSKPLPLRSLSAITPSNAP